jgi:ABC-2 type transport system permease protein
MLNKTLLTPVRLFLIRLKNNGKEQFRVWNSVLDWTVWLYLVIPGLVIFGGLYRELWQRLPEWAIDVPWTALYPVVIFVLMAFGRIRTYVEEADRLFLLQRPRWLQMLKRYGMFYSFLKQALVLLIPFAILLPFLIRAEGMEWEHIGAAYLYAWLYGMFTSMVFHQLKNIARGWRQWLLQLVTLIVLAAAYLIPMLMLSPGSSRFIPAWIGMSLVFLLSLFVCLRTGIHYEAEVRSERNARLSSTEFLMSRIIPSKPIVKVKRPLLFRRSQRLFGGTDAGTLLAEMRLKAFLRSMMPLRVWIGFLFVTSYASTLVSPPAAFALIIGFLIIGVSWLRMQWEQWYAEEFVAQFPWKGDSVKRAIRLSRFWLLLPHLSIWSGLAGYRWAGVWAIVPAAVVCGLIWWGISRSEVGMKLREKEKEKEIA